MSASLIPHLQHVVQQLSCKLLAKEVHTLDDNFYAGLDLLSKAKSDA
jgi:hypothetical protein